MHRAVVEKISRDKKQNPRRRGQLSTLDIIEIEQQKDALWPDRCEWNFPRPNIMSQRGETNGARFFRNDHDRRVFLDAQGRGGKDLTR